MDIPHGSPKRRVSMAKDLSVRGVNMGGTQKPQPKAIANRSEVNRVFQDAEVIGKILQKDCTKIADKLLAKFNVGSTSSLGSEIKSLCQGLTNTAFNSDVFGKYDRDEGCFRNGDNECGSLQGKQLPKNDAMNVFFEFAKGNGRTFDELEKIGGSITDMRSDFLSAANDIIAQFIMEQSSKTSSSKLPDGKSGINWV